jgi:hypothetical protein
MSLENWLWSLTSDGLKKLFDNNGTNNDYSVICHYTTGLLGTLYEENYLISLLYIARCCTNDQFSATQLTSLVNQTESNLKNLTTNGNPSSEKLVESVEKVVRYFI